MQDPSSPSPYRWQSWNSNIVRRVAAIRHPQSIEELCLMVREADQVRVAGTGRSSADIVAGHGVLLVLDHLDAVEAVDEVERTITVQGGMLLRRLLEEVDARGWEIPALPDIDVVTVGGALATGTHGTGREAKMLSGYVTALDLVEADGTIRTIRAGDPDMDAARLSLGLLGVIARATFQAEPRRTLVVREEGVDFRSILPRIRELRDQHEFLRLIYLPHRRRATLITGESLAEGAEAPAPRPAPKYHRHRREVSQALYRLCHRWPWLTPLANGLMDLLFFRARVVKVGSLYDTTVTKSRGSTLELAEWTIALDRFPALWEEWEALLDQRPLRAGVHIPMDIRFLRQEEAWLGYGVEGDVVTVGCVSRLAEHARDYAAFGLIEEVFLRHGGRPHWAKRFAAGPQELAPRFPRWADFRRLRAERDPGGKFLTPRLAWLFAGAPRPCPAPGPRPKAWLFDFDGVLADSDLAHRQAWQVACQEFLGMVPDLGREETHHGISALEIARLYARRAGREAEARALLDHKTAVMLRDAGAVPPLPGAREILQALERAGQAWGIVSNAPRPLVEGVLKAWGIAGGVVLGWDDVPRPKPAPDAWLEGLRRLGLGAEDAGEVWAVDDSLTGLRGAREAGLVCVGLTGTGNRAPAAWAELGLSAVVETLADLDLALLPGAPW